MAKSASKTPVDYIVPLNINGMDGRMLRLPAPRNKKREILLLYGSHASIERTLTLALEFNKYGSVILPDLPGCGGMDSLYSIGREASIDNMADYLASFVKMTYRKRRFTIIGISYGFIVATRMLQKYPEMANRVDLIISVAGFAHKDDFKLPQPRKAVLEYGSLFFSGALTSKVARLLINNKSVAWVYSARSEKNSKMRGATPEQLKERIAFEKILWRINDMRTYFYTGHSMFKVDLCDKRVDVRAYHVSVGDDQYFDNYLVEQHLNVIFKRVTVVKVDSKAHMPTIIATQEEVAPFIPTQIRRVLARP